MNLPLFVGIAWFLASLWLGWSAVGRLRRARASENWPQAPGKILESRLWGKRNVDGEMREVEHLNVLYEYRVGETIHRGRRVANSTLHYPETVELAQRFPEGSRQSISYDPEQPENSVLVRGPGRKPFSELILAGLSCLVGLGVALGGWFGLLGG